MPEASPAEAQVKDVEIPAIGISVQIELKPGHGIVYQAYVKRDTDRAEIDALLDKLTGAADRISKRYQIEPLEKAIEIEQRRLDQASKATAKLDLLVETKKATFEAGDRRRKYVESPTEAQAREQTQASIEDSNAKLAQYKADLVKLKKAAYGDVTDGSTDRNAGVPGR